MITLQIDTDDLQTIEEIKKIIVNKFKTKVKSIQNPKKMTVDEKLNKLKEFKFENKGELANAFESLNEKLSNISHLDLKEAKDEYFKQKYGL